MKKREVDHVLRAAGRIMHEKQFIIVGSQSLHGKCPDLADQPAVGFTRAARTGQAVAPVGSDPDRSDRTTADRCVHRARFR
jgi:hypothetical protein